MAAGFRRRFVHFGPEPTDFKQVLTPRAVAGAQFELYRRGGCGAGQLVLKDRFADRAGIELGDWIAFEYEPGNRWYLGRVMNRSAVLPARVHLELFGMGAELSEVFPGGFGGGTVDDARPHRYAKTDQFPLDPDRSSETVDTCSQPWEIVTKLLEQYVVPRTSITYDPSEIETSDPPADLASLKFRGEESVQSILKELAIRANDASWGVGPTGRFFFVRKRTAIVAEFQIGVDLARLEEERKLDLLFNRLLLTGGYVYSEDLGSGIAFKGFYRWRGHFVQPESRQRYGERRLKLWVPWIRTATDAHGFATRFFAEYANPTNHYTLEVPNQTALLKPWSGKARLLDRDGSEIGSWVVQTVKVDFDHAPKFTLQLGPEDPRDLWPEPPEDERWEVPGRVAGWGGSEISSQDSETGGTSATFDPSSTVDSVYSGESSSDASSSASGPSSAGSSSLSGPSSAGSSSGSAGSSDGSSSASGLSSGSGSSGSGASSGASSSGSGSSSGGGSSASGGSSSGASSSGASSSGSETGVDCCSNTLPLSLTASVTCSPDNPPGGDCANDTLTLTWNAAAGYWEGCWTPPDNLPCHNFEVCLRLRCPGGGASCDDFELDVLCDGEVVSSGLSPAASPACTCDPLDVVFSGVELGSCCQQFGTPCTCDIEITE